jgi:hypothetical protein
MKIEKEELYRLYIKEKLNQKEIGLIYSCDRKNIDYYLKKFGIPKRTQAEANALKIEKERGFILTVEMILKDINKGLLLEEIKEKYNISRSALYNLTKKSGLNFNNHSTQTALQSERLKINNPIPKGAKRNEKEMEGARKAQKELFEKRKKEADLERYCKIARYLAHKHYGRKTPTGMEIDHIYSVIDGFNNNVSLDILNHPANLRLITKSENKKKGNKSYITLEELYSFLE